MISTNIEFRTHTLANGLQLIAECNPEAYSTGIAFHVATGSRDESSEISGVSHFLEHMAFKGTPTRTAEDVNRELDEIGSQSNAFTSQEQTVYFCCVLPEYQLVALELLSDIMRPRLRDSDFNTEKQVILEEIAKYAEQPPFGALDKALARHFDQHPLAKSVLGTTESVSRLTRQQMQDYFDRQYSANNITLVMAGNIQFDQVVEQLEDHCSAWSRHDVRRETKRAAASDTASDLHAIRKDSAQQQYIIQIANGPAAQDPDRIAGRLMTTIFGDDNNSRLFWELIDTGKAEYASLESHEFQGTGIFLNYMCCQPDQTVDLMEQYNRIISEFHAQGVSQQELETAQAKVCSHVVLRSERPANRMFSIGNNWIQRGTYETTREAMSQIEAVTVQDIDQLLQQYPLTPATSVAIGPKSPGTETL